MNFGIVGAGNIAGQMADTICKMNGRAKVYAIASRSLEKAGAFAKRYEIEKAYGSYEALFADPAVDVVYIATPHAFHFEQAMEALEHGKHVLCEKAFCINERQARVLIEYARRKNLFLNEAMWTRFLPIVKIWKQVIDEGIIGKPVLLEAKFSDNVMEKERMYDPYLAGGALLDLGIYPLTLSSILWGDDVQTVTTGAVLTEQGVDQENYTMLQYHNGGRSILVSAMNTIMDRHTLVYGTEGYIAAEGISNWTGFSVYDRKRKLIKRYTHDYITGYEYEIQAVMDAIENGRCECADMTQEQTLIMMRLMDRLRREWGMVYPMESRMEDKTNERY